MEEAHRINRTFLGCKLGDTKEKVETTFKREGFSYNQDQDTLSIQGIQYGGYDVKTLSFKFYRNKLYNVSMDILPNEHESSDEPWTYNNLANVLYNKYGEDVPNPYEGKKYNNMKFHYDAHTLVSLWYATWRMGNYRVTLSYYDRDSGYKEHQAEGFKMRLSSATNQKSNGQRTNI